MTTIRMVSRIPPALDHVRLLSSCVRGISLEFLAGKPYVELVELAVAEACTNIVRHAGAPTAGEIELEVVIGDTDIDFVLRDRGDAFAPAATEMPIVDPNKPETLPEGGYGVPLIYRIMDAVQYAREGTTNVLRMRCVRPADSV